MENSEIKLEALRLASIGDREHSDYLKKAEERFKLFVKLLTMEDA